MGVSSGPPPPDPIEPEGASEPTDPSSHDEPAGHESIGLDALADPTLERLTVEGEIARGGMGVVLRVRDQILRRDLAMKKVKGAVLGIDKTGSTTFGTFHSLPRLIRRLLDEAQITAQLDHSGVVPVHELGVDKDGEVYFTMKRVRGMTLGNVFTEYRMDSPEWPLPRVLRILLQVAETLAYAHAKGVVHRDLKPSNVMVGRFGEVYVMDWGLAKVLGAEPTVETHEPRPTGPRASQVVTDQSAAERRGDEAGITMHGDVVGTLGYMAPEQATGGVDSVDERSDVYSVGCLLYHVLAGHPPYLEPNGTRNTIEVLGRLMEGPPAPLAHVAPQAPAELVAIAERAMAHRAEDRFPNVVAVAQDLRAYLEGRVVQSYRTGPWIEIKKWVTRNKGLAAGIGLGILAAIGGIVGYGVLQKQAATAIGKERDAANEAATLAEMARREAVGVRLAAQARLIAEEQPNVALALALEAHDRAPGQDAKSALYAALDTHREIATLHGANSYARHLRFIRGGRELLCVDRAGGVTIWDMATYEPVRFSEPCMGACTRAAISRDGRYIFASGDQEAPFLLDLEAGTRSRIDDPALFGAQGRFSKSGNHMLIAERAGRVTLREVPSCKVLEELLPEGGLIQFSTELDPRDPRDLPTIIECSVRDRLIAYDLEKLEVLWTRDDVPSPSSANAMRYSEDGASFFTEYAGNYQIAWRRTSDGTRLEDLKIEGRPINTAMPIPGSSDIIAKGPSSIPNQWATLRMNPETREVVWMRAAPGPYSPYTITRDGASAGLLGPTAAAILDLRTGRLLSELQGHRYRLADLQFAPGGDVIATASHDRTVKLWRLGPPSEGRALLQALGDDLELRTTSGDGELALAYPRAQAPEERRDYTIIEVDTGKTITNVKVGPDLSFGPIFDRANDLMWWFENPLTLCRARISTGERISTVEIPWPEGLPGPHGRQISPDGKRIALTPSVGGAYIHDVETGARLAHLGADRPLVRYLRWSPDGREVLFAHSNEGRFSVLDAASGELRTEFGGHTGFIREIEYLPDGRGMVSSAVDSSIRVWDMERGKLSSQIVGLPMSGNPIAISPTGEHLIVHANYQLELYALDGLETPVLQARIATPKWRPGLGFTPDGQRFWVNMGNGRLLFHRLDVVAHAEQTLAAQLNEFDLRRVDLGSERDQEAALARARRQPDLEARLSRLTAHIVDEEFDEADAMVDVFLQHRPTWGLALLSRARIAALRAKDAPEAERAALFDRAFAALEKALDNGLQYDIRGYRWQQLRELERLQDDPRWDILTSDRGR